MIARGADLAWTPSRIDAPGADGSIGIVVSANHNVGRPAIQVAIEGGKGALIANGPGVHDREGPPPFREASNREPSEALAVLLEAGANPDAAGQDGATALHLAVRAGRLDMVRLLAGHGARLAVRDRDGLTPLELAEKVERIESEGAPRRSAYREPDPGPGLATRQAMTSLLRELGSDGAVPAGITPTASRSGSMQ
jgi:ankyrin repeat protein